MRITEHRMIELAAGNVSRQRERVAEAGEQLSSGERVSRPSEDPSAWAAARRADASRMLNAGRGDALAGSQERLALVDDALSQIGEALQRARELAVMASSDTMSVDQLTAIAAEVRGVQQSAMAAANTRATDGEYILAGSRGDQPAFDADGVYQGDDLTRTIETQSGLEQRITVSGSALTSASGIDIFAELAALHTALTTNDRAGIRAAVETLIAANQQVSAARSDVGAQSASLLDAEEVQRNLNDSLVALESRLVGADPIAAASELAQHSHALEAAQTVASRIVELVRP
jgi:flagellar hook-associated protein 3 FlgL